jgi:hypothetical protein
MAAMVKPYLIQFNTFDQCINALITAQNRETSLGAVLEGYSWNMTADLQDIMVTLLTELFHDKNDTIGWWLYEDVEKVITFSDGRKWHLSTTKDLYEYLVFNMEEEATDAENA